jgi:nitrate/TMAO reductase-like tetraheme cytochrome c subunit
MHDWNPLAFVVLGCGAATATILIVYLVKRPAIDMKVKLWLLLGLGVFPALTAGSSTVVGMEATTHRNFCGSCHVMTAHYEDASDPHAQSLAARHSRNPFFGDRSCYVCHADYGMYGYAMTKAGGLRHVYMYYLGGYMHMPLEEAKKTIRLVKAYDNLNCRQCHTATLRDWRRIPDHESLKAQLDSNQVSCASAGCHGFAHPFTKTAYAGVLVPGRAGGPDTVPPPSAAPSGKPSSGMPSSSAAPRRDMPQPAPNMGQP